MRLSLEIGLLTAFLVSGWFALSIWSQSQPAPRQGDFCAGYAICQ